MRELGWSSFFDDHFVPHAAEGLVPARVAVQHRGEYVLYAECGELRAELAGKLQGDYAYKLPGKLAFAPRVLARLPAVGDWVAAAVRPDEGRGTIHATLPRRTAFSRKQVLGLTEEQVLAANIDTMFVTSALDVDDGADAPANRRRLERFLAMANEGGARPVILLTKADLHPDPHGQARSLAALGAEVLVTSALSRDGLDGLDAYLAPGQTVALLGSSGVGKSTLINTLLGADMLATREVGPNSLGRHTTARRELIRLPGRGLVIDTPGLREIQLWDADSGVGGAFADIESLAERCRFRDCHHDAEPGCAVLEALESGTLEPARLSSFRRVLRELEYLDQKQSARGRADVRHKYRALAKRSRSALARRGRP